MNRSPIYIALALLSALSSQPTFGQGAASPLPPLPPSNQAGPVLPPPLDVPPPIPAPAATPPVMPFPHLPVAPLDLAADNVGLAQKAARSRGLQARILWVDGTSNLDFINSNDKIDALVKQAKTTGFNIIVLDVKPIIGYTLYPSHIARKLTDWKGATLPQTFDPLASFVRSAHAAGLQLVANVAVFSEGHKYFQKGDGYLNDRWQTVLYEPQRTVHAPVMFSPNVVIADTQNLLPVDQSQLAIYTDMSFLRRPLDNVVVDVVDLLGRVVGQVEGSALGMVTVSAPPQGAVIVGQGKGAEFLRNTTHVNDILTYESIPRFVPISQATEQKTTLFVNPNDPEVEQRELDIVAEIARGYDIDGVIFDDRLRFAAINADFSTLSRKQFEAYVGHEVAWPDDVFKYSPYPNQSIIKGPEYDAWLIFRALTIRNWLAKARATIKFYRPKATVSVYVGSWYGEYDGNGANWASDDINSGFPFSSPSFQQTGFAGLLDWMTTGCYYRTASIQEGVAAGDAGATVEAAGQLSNRLVADSTWVYAGLYADMFQNQADELGKCLQAAAATTQEIMVFDVSQIRDYGLWPVFQNAFEQPAIPPHDEPGLMDDIHANRVSTPSEIPHPPIPSGTPGTGL